MLVENLKLETAMNCHMSQNWLQLFRMVSGIPGLEMILIPRGILPLQTELRDG